MRTLSALVFAIALSAFQFPPLDPDPGPAPEDERTICFPYIGCFEI